MKEYVTEGVVLSNEPFREYDRLTHVYTKYLGHIEARVTGGRKILSKFALHLDPMNYVRLRIVEKNQLTITDALTENRFPFIRNDLRLCAAALNCLLLIKIMFPKMIPDTHVWYALFNDLQKGYTNIHSLLQILGYNPLLAECSLCSRKPVMHFSTKEHTFLCKFCGGKVSEKETIRI